MDQNFSTVMKTTKPSIHFKGLQTQLLGWDVEYVLKQGQVALDSIFSLIN